MLIQDGGRAGSSGLALIGLSLYRLITILNNGQKQIVQGFILTSGQILR